MTKDTKDFLLGLIDYYLETSDGKEPENKEAALKATEQIEAAYTNKTANRIYVHHGHGVIYHLDGDTLMFAPLLADGGLYDLETDGGEVDMEEARAELGEAGMREIEDIINRIRYGHD